jgi:hypothetical protein
MRHARALHEHKNQPCSDSFTAWNKVLIAMRQMRFDLVGGTAGKSRTTTYAVDIDPGIVPMAIIEHTVVTNDDDTIDPSYGMRKVTL